LLRFARNDEQATIQNFPGAAMWCSGKFPTLTIARNIALRAGLADRRQAG
jgi:hypothetical protein